MSQVEGGDGRAVVPTFGECVVGYRVWGLDDAGQLWPLAKRRLPWNVGINTARCNCQTADQLHFEWSLVRGQRRLEPAPLHDAPAETCRCGLYSLRRPTVGWADDPALRSGLQVAGAVASWGRLQVHATGARAEHACVLALAFVPGAQPGAVERVERAAQRYEVEAVPVADLEAVAALHAQPLPDAIHDAADQPHEPVGTDEPIPVDTPTRPPAPAGAVTRKADATEDDVDNALLRARPGALRARHAVLALALVSALMLLLVVLDHHPSGCRIIHASGPYVQSVDCSHDAPSGR